MPPRGPGPTRYRIRSGLCGASVLAAALLVPEAISAQPNPQAILLEKLDAKLTALVDDFEGIAGVQAVDLTTGDVFAVHADFVFPQASAIKIPLLFELFRRESESPGFIDQRRGITDAVRTGGSGVLRHLSDGGTEMSLDDLAVFMIVYSDNTATNLLIDAVGIDAVNALMDDLGAPRTRLQRKMIQPAASARGDENLSTPAEAAGLMVRLASCDLPLSAEACTRVKEILMIAKGGPFRDPVPSSVPMAWKPGAVDGVATAWGIVALDDRPYALAVMTSWGRDGGELVRQVQDAVYGHFSRLDRSTEYGVRVPRGVLPLRGGGSPAPDQPDG